jgi:hypothetical protein
MAMSASRIRSTSKRNRIAEEMAFPGLRRRTSACPYNVKSSVPSQFRGGAMQLALTRAGLV